MNAQELDSEVMENVITKDTSPAISLFINSLQIMTSIKESVTDTIISLQLIKEIVSDERKLSALPDGIKKILFNYLKTEACETVVEKILITEQLDSKTMQNNISTKETNQEHIDVSIDANIIGLSSVKENLENSITKLTGVIDQIRSSENKLSVPTENIPVQYDQNFEVKFVEAVDLPPVKGAEQPTAKAVEPISEKAVELSLVKGVEDVKGVELPPVRSAELPPVKGDNNSFTSCERCGATLCERCGATTCKRCGVSFCEKCGPISSKCR